MFVLYRVKSSNNFYGTLYAYTASNTKSPHKSQIVASDNYQVTFILSEQMFEVSSISSHTGAQPSTPRGRLPHRWYADADQTRSRSNQEPLKFAFWIKKLHKFKVFGSKNLNREFSDKDGNVKSVNKLLKKLRHSDSMTRRTGAADVAVCVLFWCVASFYKIQYEHIKRDMNWACTCVCFKFPGVCFCHKLSKSDKIRQRYHKNKKGDNFFGDTSVL